MRRVGETPKIEKPVQGRRLPGVQQWLDTLVMPTEVEPDAEGDDE